MHAERLQGILFGGLAIAVALMFLAIAILDGEAQWRIAWFGAVSGWFLTAIGLMAIGEERAKARL